MNNHHKECQCFGCHVERQSAKLCPPESPRPEPKPTMAGTFVSEEERTIVRLTDENRQLRTRVATLRRSEELLLAEVLEAREKLESIAHRLDDMVSRQASLLDLKPPRGA